MKLTPMLTSIIPVRKDFWQDEVPEQTINHNAAGLNKRLQLWCADHGTAFIDVTSNLAEAYRLKLEYTTDGIHLNDKGYQVLFGCVERRLNF